MPVNRELIELCRQDDVARGREVIKVSTATSDWPYYHVEGASTSPTTPCHPRFREAAPKAISKGHVIECDFHQGKFDIRDGRIVAPPCVVELKTYKVVAPRDRRDDRGKPNED